MARAGKHIVETSFHVRYAETDKMGVVHHSAYLTWFEEGRSAYIRAQGWSYAEIEKSGYHLAAAQLQATYKRAARYDQVVTVKTWVEEARSRSVRFGCDIVEGRDGSLLFSAELNLICLNAAGAVARIPAAWSAWLRI